MDVCFSGAALGLLGAIWLVLQAVIVTLFWGWINSLKDSVKEARDERDRAANNLDQALGLGEALVPAPIRAAGAGRARRV